jgi:transcription antitermination factor NusG
MARWYIIHAYSGFENKVRDSVLADAERMGLTEFVEAVEVPVETVTEVKRGKKVQAERKFFPGYVLAKLTMTDDVYHLVKNTPKVTGFLGSMGKPQAISESEAARILNSKEEAAARPKQEITKSAIRSRCSTAPSPVSTAWSRNWISKRRASRCRCRSLVAPRRSSWISNKSNA